MKRLSAAVPAVSRAAPFVRRVAVQLRSVSVLDLSTRLAAQVFLTALPMLFVIAAYCPQEVREQLRTSLRDVLGIQGIVQDQVERLYAGGERGSGAWGVVSAVVSLVSATALSRVLQRLCERSWQLPHTTARTAVWRWFLWLLVWSTALVFQGVVRGGFGAGALLGFPLQVAAATGLWWWTQHLLLAGRVGWLPLLPGAVLTGAGTSVFAATSSLWMPRTLQRSVDQFGLLGSVFTVLSWLILFCTTVVAGIAIGWLVAQERSVRRLLALDRGGFTRAR
ncbi:MULTISPECIES: ribonuclease BN [Streptomyces]|uniref:ribonuclease BN n=1 Tax=Streptomyces TaxID=1883 RepID=UPI000A62CE3E|nr:ribonuclease BN [Streptomyces niger]